MKKSKLFVIIGLILLVGLPTYQILSSKKEKWGDDSHINVYGKNFLSPLLGVKKVWQFYNFEPADGVDSHIDWSGTVVETPDWMRFIGFNKKVVYGLGMYQHPDEQESSSTEVVFFLLFRSLAKLLIPGIFFFLAYYFKKKKM